jgi:hypothetical protein
MSLRRVVLVGGLATGLAALAEVKEIDRFLDAPASARLPEVQVPGVVTSEEPRLGVPIFLWLDRQTPPLDLAAQGVTAPEAARRVLARVAALYRFRVGDLLEGAVPHVHDTGEGPVIVSFERRLAGVPVFRERLRVLMTRQLEPVAVSGFWSPLPARRRTFALSADTAIARALDSVIGPLAPRTLRPSHFDEAGFQHFAGDVPGFQLAWARAKKTYASLPQRRALEPAWHVEFAIGPSESTTSEAVGAVVLASDGELAWQTSLTAKAPHGYRVWADPTTTLPLDSPAGRAQAPHLTGLVDGWSPAHVPPSLVTLDHGPISTMDPWLPAGATAATGNNAEAFADVASPDGFSSGDVRVTPSMPGLFGGTFDPSAPPNTTAQRVAAGQQLFYVVNWLHDWFYDKGFDEAAGNAQTSNFGRGGAGMDPVLIEVQDFSGSDNAAMTTPADGVSPKLETYLFRTPSPARFQSASPALDVSATPADFGPPVFSVMAQLTRADPVQLCTAAVNTLSGRLAVVDRGTCGFKQKALNAQAAGAVGVVFLNTGGTLPSLQNDATPGTVTIPSLMVTSAQGMQLLTAMASGVVTATISRVAAPFRDAAMDTSLMAHEWGHSLTSRLVGGGVGFTGQQARGLAEGWSDFVALLLTIEAQDATAPAGMDFSGVYAFTPWALDSPATVTNAAYFGFRRLPFSVNFARDALTFRHIADGQALPSTHPMRSFGPNSQIHNTGEVWATMLLEGYVALLRDRPRLTFPQAQDRMLRALVASLKLTPQMPTLLEARDALLAVLAASDRADFLVFAQAFARRGAGVTAQGPDRTAPNNAPVVESFVTGSEVRFVSAVLDDQPMSCDSDGTLDVGEVGRLRLTFRNTGTLDLTGLAVTPSSALAGVTFTPPTVTATTIAPYATQTVEVQVRLPAGLSAPTVLPVSLSFTAPGLTTPGPRTASATFAVHSDTVLNASANDDADADRTAWTASIIGAPADEGFRRVALTALTGRYSGPASAYVADSRWTSPVLQVGPGPFTVTFQGRFDFELAGPSTPLDGAVLELSSNGGQTWTDVGAMATPAYTGTFTVGASGDPNESPLAGRPGWGGRSAGYPNFVPFTVNLGTAYAGQSVQLRFRIGTDDGTSAAGFDLDSFVFTGLSNTPFTQRVTHRALCGNRPPMVTASGPSSVSAGAMVTLAGTASDPDGNPLTLAWTQVSGPSVMLTGATTTTASFTAPSLPTASTLTFRFTASDGMSTSQPAEVTVQVAAVVSVDAGIGGDAGASVDAGSDAGLADAGAQADAGPTVDAGSSVDAGAVDDAGASDSGTMVDGGPAEPDAGTPDAGPMLMADAGGSEGIDAGVDPPTPPSGCGCSAGEGAFAWLLGFVVALTRRRHRGRA